MLEARGLRKSYGARVAVDAAALTVSAGEVVGLLGPNGAGKTTTLSMLAGVLAPDEGEVCWNGRRLDGDADPARRRFGLVPQDLALYESLTASENLSFFAALQGLAGRQLAGACQRGLALAGLEQRGNERVDTFSGGMKRRLNFAAGLVHDPDVLLVDEPTVGVDAQSRAFLLEGLHALKARGKAIVYTSHYLEEVERLCDRVVVIDGGRVVAHGPTAEIGGRLGSETTLVVELDDSAPPACLDELRRLAGVSRVAADGRAIRAMLSDVTAGAAAILGFLAHSGARIRQVATERASLEQAFLALTGKELRDP